MLYDSGCSSAAILTVAAMSVQITPTSRYCKLSTFDNDECAFRDFASFEIVSLDGAVRVKVADALVGDSLTVQGDRPPTNAEIMPFEYLSGVMFDELEDETIGVILGAPYAWLWMEGETRFHSPEYPLAKHSKLGWVLIGPGLDRSSELSESQARLAVGVEDPRILSLNLEIKRMFRHDFIMPGPSVHAESVYPSRQDEFSRAQMEESIKVDSASGRYVVALPWRNGRAEAARKFAMTDSYSNAKRRLLRERPKLVKDEFRRDGVFAQLDKLREQGHVREVVERDLTGLPLWYSPIVIVLQPNKPIAKRFRLCQDSGAVTQMCEGPMWLNAELSIGPDILTRMTSILFKFRRHPITLMADVSDFFHRIWVADEDVAALRFLFFKDKSLSEIVALEMMVHIFGAGSSPTVANFTLQHHAERIRQKYGDVIYEQILHRFYVDDYLSSLESVEVARDVKKRMTEALASGGFELTKWQSNDDSVLSDPMPSLSSQASLGLVSVPGEERGPVPITSEVSASLAAIDADRKVGRPMASVSVSPSITDIDGDEEEVTMLDNVTPSLSDSLKAIMEEELFNGDMKGFIRPDAEESTKVLGVGYDKKKDVLFVRIPSQAEKEVVTMTDVLSIVSSYFDPLGISAPYCLTGRLVFQECNQRKLGWKDPLPEDLKQTFVKWLLNRDGLRQISVPRWTASWELSESVVDLCVFGDSSREAYGACAYLRRYLPDESVVLCRLVFGKGHVVPLQMHVDKLDGQLDHNGSIPRCELTAARLAAEICSLVQREEDETFNNIYLFTDSMSILLWLRDVDRKHKAFEHFRLRRIWGLTEVPWWRYCPTDTNPSDILTHPLLCRPRDADKWRLYLDGPAWLWTPVSQWPSEPKVPPAELIPIASMNTIVDFDVTTLFPDRLHTRRSSACGSSSSSVSVVEEAARSTVSSPQSSTPSLLPPTSSPQHSPTVPPSRSLSASTLERISLAPAVAIPRLLPTPEAPKVNFLLAYTENKSVWAAKVNKVFRMKERWLYFRDFVKGKPISPSVREFASPSEFSAAETLLLGAVQRKYFSSEIQLLLNHAVFTPNGPNEFGDRKSRLTNLNPFLDENMIMRSGSRIEYAEVEFDTRFPIILPPKSPEVYSIIRHIHETLGHALLTHLLHYLRKRYYIIDGKAAVAHVLRYCTKCQRFDKAPTCQKMSVLPEPRVSLIWPFRSSALDVLGPYDVTHSGRGTNKRYVLLITCPSTRAIALYPLFDMSTQSFLNALTKFQSTYPGVQQIICDQGTNFTGAANLCKELVEEFNTEVKMGELALRHIDFRFNCPYASHTGGVFERLVRNTKRALHFILSSHKITFDSFDTALFKCAFILNSRPLCPSSNDITSMQCLSPQNFLTPYMFSPEFSLDPPVTACSADLRGSWFAVRKVVDHFKDRWTTEYLTTLQNRQKWHKSQEEFYLGQLVLISGPNAPRTQWHIGRVEEKLPSLDSITRRYRIRLPDGRVLERHHNVLVPLEMEHEP